MRVEKKVAILPCTAAAAALPGTPAAAAAAAVAVAPARPFAEEVAAEVAVGADAPTAVGSTRADVGGNRAAVAAVGVDVAVSAEAVDVASTDFDVEAERRLQTHLNQYIMMQLRINVKKS